jgi:hypothetical protein
VSAELAIEDVDVDLKGNSATASITVNIDELFDENGELRLWEADDGWSGFVLEDGAYFALKTWLDESDPFRKIRVGQRSVRLAVREHIEDPDAGGVGNFARGARR